MEAVLAYLEQVDPEAARRARHRYACFDHFGEDTQAYGYATGFGLSRSCEHEVVSQLVELRQRATRVRAAATAAIAADDFFFAEQNARLVRNAEEYYRTMFLGRVVVVEPARPPHGRDARGALSRTSTATPRARRRSWSGRTTRTSATRARRRWARRAS